MHKTLRRVHIVAGRDAQSVLGLEKDAHLPLVDRTLASLTYAGLRISK